MLVFYFRSDFWNYIFLRVEKRGRKKIKSLYKEKCEDWIKSLDVFFAVELLPV